MQPIAGVCLLARDALGIGRRGASALAAGLGVIVDIEGVVEALHHFAVISGGAGCADSAGDILANTFATVGVVPIEVEGVWWARGELIAGTWACATQAHSPYHPRTGHLTSSVGKTIHVEVVSITFQLCALLRAGARHAFPFENLWARLLAAIADVPVIVEPVVVAFDAVANKRPCARGAAAVAHHRARNFTAIPCIHVDIEPVLLARQGGADA